MLNILHLCMILYNVDGMAPAGLVARVGGAEAS